MFLSPYKRLQFVSSIIFILIPRTRNQLSHHTTKNNQPSISSLSRHKIPLSLESRTACSLLIRFLVFFFFPSKTQYTTQTSGLLSLFLFGIFIVTTYPIFFSSQENARASFFLSFFNFFFRPCHPPRPSFFLLPAFFGSDVRSFFTNSRFGFRFATSSQEQSCCCCCCYHNHHRCRQCCSCCL